jgi:hypothetical protein
VLHTPSGRRCCILPVAVGAAYSQWPSVLHTPSGRRCCMLLPVAVGAACCSQWPSVLHAAPSGRRCCILPVAVGAAYSQWPCWTKNKNEHRESGCSFLRAAAAAAVLCSLLHTSFRATCEGITSAVESVPLGIRRRLRQVGVARGGAVLLLRSEILVASRSNQARDGHADGAPYL